MAESKPAPSSNAGNRKKDRRARLAEALRANLARRKRGVKMTEAR